MKKLVSLLLVCLLALSMAALAEGQYPVTWSQNLDGNDYEFTVEAAPSRAVSMSQATTEMMLALGLADKMAGTAFLEEEIYEPLAEDYAKVEVLAEKWPSYEVFMAAAPDFTTGWAVPFTQRAIPAADIAAMFAPIIVVLLPNLSNTAPVITLPIPLHKERIPTSNVADEEAIPTKRDRSFAMEMTVLPTAARKMTTAKAFQNFAERSIWAVVRSRSLESCCTA